MTRGVLQNYIKASPKTGRLSYRRRIPAKLKKHFTKPDGSTRGLERNEKLDTKSISIALRKASIINDRFERTKAMAQQLWVVILRPPVAIKFASGKRPFEFRRRTNS